MRRTACAEGLEGWDDERSEAVEASRGREIALFIDHMKKINHFPPMCSAVIPANAGIQAQSWWAKAGVFRDLDAIHLILLS